MQRATIGTDTTKRGVTATTVAEALEHTVAAVPDRVALRTRGGEYEITWAEYGEQVDRIALGLKALGLGPGQTFALMLNNRPEFHLADSACLSLGATPFSLYQTLTPEQVAYQLNDSGAEIVVTEPAFIEVVNAARKDAPQLRHVVLVDAGDGMQADVSFDDLLESEGDPEEIAAARAAVAPDDLLTLIYTSAPRVRRRASSSPTRT